MQATMTDLTKWERKRLARDAMKVASSYPEYYRKPYWISGMWFLDKAGEHRRTAFVRMEWVMDGIDPVERKRWIESYFDWKRMAKDRLSGAMGYKGATLPLP